MLLFILFCLPILVPAWTSYANDPSAGVIQTRQSARNLDCEVLTQQEAHDRAPGVVSEPATRASFMTVGAMSCRARIFNPGERVDAEEALLGHLSALSDEIAAAARASSGGDLTWMVDAFHPDEIMTRKLVFASKVALAEHGARVSDRLPMLAAGDILVLGRMPPSKSYPLACARYYAEGSLSASEALLGVVQLDARETVVHAGVCTQGVWRWIQ